MFIQSLWTLIANFMELEVLKKKPLTKQKNFASRKERQFLFNPLKTQQIHLDTQVHHCSFNALNETSSKTA